MGNNCEIRDKMDSYPVNPYITKTKEIANKVIMNITVEPVIFFYAIGFGITTIISPALYFDKICKVTIKILNCYLKLDYEIHSNSNNQINLMAFFLYLGG